MSAIGYGVGVVHGSRAAARSGCMSSEAEDLVAVALLCLLLGSFFGLW